MRRGNYILIHLLGCQDLFYLLLCSFLIALLKTFLRCNNDDPPYFYCLLLFIVVCYFHI